MTKTLPQNFFFGAAMSGPQTEGAYTKDNRLEVFGIHGLIYLFLIFTTK